MALESTISVFLFMFSLEKKIYNLKLVDYEISPISWNKFRNFNGTPRLAIKTTKFISLSNFGLI